MRLVHALAISLVAFACTDDPIDDDELEPYESQLTGPLRGVDRAGAFTVREARELHTQHGVHWTGVYIGGACNAGSGWTKARVKAIRDATSWRFMPIWVGQQTSSICSHHALDYERGLVDGKHAAAQMRAFGWHRDREIPIALDVEGGTYEAHPHASTAYVRGWTRSIHAAGYLAYVYSSELGIEHYHDAGVPLDGVWVASWSFHGFHAADPATLSLGHRYKHHDRAWQYAGDFSVAGAGRVDGNTADLLLAPGPGGTNVAAGNAGAEELEIIDTEDEDDGMLDAD